MLQEMLEKLIEHYKKWYESIEAFDNVYFICAEICFRFSIYGKEIVLEIANSENDAKLNWFEDTEYYNEADDFETIIMKSDKWVTDSL